MSLESGHKKETFADLSYDEQEGVKNIADKLNRLGRNNFATEIRQWCYSKGIRDETDITAKINRLTKFARSELKKLKALEQEAPPETEAEIEELSEAEIVTDRDLTPEQKAELYARGGEGYTEVSPDGDIVFFEPDPSENLDQEAVNQKKNKKLQPHDKPF